MVAATEYVTREEFEPVKIAVERLSIQFEVMSTQLHQLTLKVADLTERIEQLDGRMDRLEKAVHDGNAAITSVLLARLPQA